MRFFPLGVLLACAAAFGSAADEKPVAKLDPVAVSQLVAQLGSDDAATREKATAELSKLEEAPDALREATKSEDPEVRRGAQAAVEAIAAHAREKAFKARVPWIISKDFESNEAHDPLVVGDKVVVGTDKGQLRAYRCADGSACWVHEHGARIFHRP